MSRTRIIFTVGPSTDDIDVLTEIFRLGGRVVRFNFSHGTYADHERRLAMVREANARSKKRMMLLADTRGPEVRVEHFANGKVMLKDGQDFLLTGRDVVGDEHQVSVSFRELAHSLHPGDMLALSDGLLYLRVEKIAGLDIHTKVVYGGELSDRKRVAVPGVELPLEFLSEQDKKDILFAAEHGFHCIALSFVQRPEDVLAVRKLLDDNGFPEVMIQSKIENAAALRRLSKIIKVSDAVMVARGDLGVEIPLERVPLVQKRIIKGCLKAKVDVTTATQMLESMCENIRPTRAEVCDVANAIVDGTDYVMLSGETASGRYPAEAVRMMKKIVNETERSPEFRGFMYWMKMCHAFKTSRN